MPQFAPDLVAFGDQAGYGLWDIGHVREHMQFTQVLAGLTPAIEIADYPLLSFMTLPEGPASQMAALHSTLHDLLRNATGVTGVDLTGFGPHNQEDFDDLLNYHRQEHAQMRSVLGLI